MQLGYDAKRLFLNNRGLGSYSRNLLYGLSKYTAENTYHLFSPRIKNEHVSPTFINSLNVKVHLPSGMGLLSSNYWRSGMLGSVAQKLGLDVFHGLSQELPLDIRKFKGKSVVTIHDMIFLQRPEFYRPIDRWIYYKKVKFAVENSDSIIAISNNTKSDLVNEFGLDDSRIDVVYQSCDEVFYDRRKDRENEIVRKKWNLPENYILYVGALNENKNVLIILKAMAALGHKMDLPLVVIGKGNDYREKLENYIRRNGLSDRVLFGSDIANPSALELSSLYQMATMFIFPSYYEGFGIPIIEARFSNVPVLASNSSCLDEAGGTQAMYFDPDNAEELAEKMLHATTNEHKQDDEIGKFHIKSSLQSIINIYTA